MNDTQAAGARRPARASWGEALALVSRVAGAYALTREELLASDRRPLTVEARRVAMQLLRERGLDVVTIGRIMERDHSTVLHHLALIQQSPTPDERIMLARLRRPLVP